MTRSVSTAILTASILAAACALRADEPRTQIQDHYPDLFAQFEKWNAGKMEWMKEQFDGLYKSEVKRLAIGKPAGWAESRLKVWEGLPPTLKSDKQLSEPAMLMIAGYYGENAKAFAMMGEGTQQTALIECKLYLIMAVGEKHAVEAKHEKIEPSDLFVGFRDAWTSLWPFCPEK